jgi:tetratricopeptide (TPR) repeat protein
MTMEYSLSKTAALRSGVIVLITLLVYTPAMRAGFVWDDDLFLTENPLIKADDGLYRFWLTTEPPDYFPLVSTSLWLEWRLWGMNATGYHVVNIVLHAVSSMLIWLVLSRLKIPGAWLAAVVFAIHPVNVESVAWITERKNIQPMVFYLLTILSYLQFQSTRRKRWYLFALCSFLLALASKTSVVMLPFVLLGCAWWERGRIAPKDLLRSIPFFILSAVFGLVTVWFQYNVAIGEDVVRAEGFFSRLAGAGWAIWFYIYKAVFPHRLSFVYPRWDIDPYSIVSYLPGLIFVVCMGVFWRYRKGWGKAPLFGLGYFAVTLFPVLGFFDINFMRYSLVTDHWQYTSIIGIIALVVGVGKRVLDGWQRRPRKLVSAAAAVLVGVLGITTWSQCHIYKDVEALWRDTISKNPNAWLAHHNLGTALLAQGRFEEAITHCSEALRINPHHAKIHCALGSALAGEGKFDEAVMRFSEALRISPGFAEAHNDLGCALDKLGRLDEAIHHFAQAVKLNPEYAEAHLNLGIGLARKGMLDQAINHFSEALRIEPDSAGASYSLGLALVGRGKRGEAIAYLSQAVKFNPEFAEAHYNLGAVLAQLGRLEEAITHFSEALRIRPGFEEARYSLSRALEESRRQRKVSNPDTAQ